MACNPSLLTPVGPGTKAPITAVVVGAGRSGQAAARLLRALGAEVRLLDQKGVPAEFAAWAKDNGVALVIGEHKPEHFAGADILVPSPGAAVATLLPLLGGASPEIMAETELAWRCLEGEPVLAVTGTSGKTTTTSLCAAMLEAQGLSVFTGGNIGTPLSEYVLARRANSAPKVDVVVLELSSFQLQTVSTLRPKVAVLLNVAENHLDYHKDMAEYIEAKMRLFRCQTGDDLAVFGLPLKGLITEGMTGRFRVPGRVVYFDPAARRFPNTKLLGGHNQANAEAAWQACRAFGVSEENAAKAMAAFTPLANRLEAVAEQDGVLFVNDSKCTTLEALKVALEAFERPILLLAGGKFKGGDPAALAPLLKERVKAVGLYGASRDVFETAWSGAVPVTWDETLRQALARLRGLARPGDVVLLAPATASYDQYQNYEKRGDDFRDAVRDNEENRA